VLDRPVALKVIRFGGDEHSRAVERFTREARAAAALNHPNLCPVFDVGEFAGFHYLTMPLLTGRSLAAWVRETGPLAERTAARLAAKAARALEVAHGGGLIHRDLKPSNIMVNDRQEPVVIDFGLSRRLAGGDPQVTPSGAVLGTPAYLAPERVTDGHGEPGPAVDVYSLGVVLYEMLTGRVPFQGTLYDVLIKAVRQDPDPPSRHRPGLSPRLEAVCLKAMSKDPRDRYAGMAEFAEALEGWLDDTPSPTPSPRRPPAVVRLGGRRVVGGTILGIAVLAALVLWARRGETPDPRPGVIDPGRGASGRAEADPRAARAHVDRAWALNDGGDLDLAVRECEAALRLDDRCVGALACRANVLIKRRDFPAAVADLTRAIAIDPGYHMAYVDRAWAHNASGDHDRALADAGQAVRLKPDEAEGYYQRGSARAGKGMHREAVEDFTLAIRYRAGYALAYYERARSYRALGNTELEAKDLASARQINPAVGGAPPARDAAARTKLLVPAYFDPTGPGREQWERILRSPAASDLIVVVNPDDGPGRDPDPDYTAVLKRMRDAGIVPIGFVDTDLGSRPIAEVTREVDDWFRLYPQIRGIFFERQEVRGKQLDYYAGAARHVRRKQKDAVVATNPGDLECSRDYLALADVDLVCVHEARRDQPMEFPAWMIRDYRPKLAVLLYEVRGAGLMGKSARDLIGLGVRCFHLTHRKEDDAWERLPDWWEELARQVHDHNAAVGR
jgi:tetratricopeptide (TPR) repeat protein